MTSRKTLIAILAAAVTLAAAGGALYQAGLNQGLQRGMQARPAATAPAGGPKERKVLYWHDPMVPGPKFDKPGKSPFMDMQLVPVYADEAADDGAVAISPRVRQNLGIRTTAVTEGMLAPALEAVGSVAYDERAVAVVQARASGYVERVHVRAPLDAVRRGQPLAELYVPDWIAAQEEFLAARRMSAELADAARQRMRLAGMTDEQIRNVETGGTVQPRVTLTAPVSGVVGELAAREGMTVTVGAPLYRINGLSTVWVLAEIPESAAGQVHPGNAVEARAAAWPGAVFKGTVGALLPEIDPSTRTFKARIELANPGGRLVPGMFARIHITSAPGKPMLLVPSEAVIQTGKRNVVFVEAGAGRFAPAEVETGVEANGMTEIRHGLAVGQKVVTSGQFLVDSEASLKGAIGRMADDNGGQR